MEITAVPLQPMPKGVMTKLWVGIVVCVVLASGLAFAGTRHAAQVASFNAICGKLAFDPVDGGVRAPELFPSGLRFQTVRAGKGAMPTDDDIALVAYKGTLSNGSVFDENPRAPLPVAGVVPGFGEGLKHMQAGGRYRLCIPAALGYGAAGAGGGKIPSNATLLFQVDLLDFKSKAEIEQMQMRQSLQQQGQQQAQKPQN